jgi:hypothetical protein
LKETNRHKQFYYITGQRVKETTGIIYFFMQSLPGTIEGKAAPFGPAAACCPEAEKMVPGFGS